MPKFGPRKIGQAAFARNKIRETQTQKFGPRKFGAKKAAQMKQDMADAEAAVAAELGAPPAPAPQGDRPTTSVKQMAVALGDNPALLDDFIALEKERTGGARKTAVKLFLGTELAKAEDTREEVVADLQALLQ